LWGGGLSGYSRNPPCVLGTLLHKAITVRIFSIGVESHATPESANGTSRHVPGRMTEGASSSTSESLFIHASADEAFNLNGSITFGVQLFLAVLGPD
jgi:hypothetical protein